MLEKQIMSQLCLLPDNLKIEVSHYIAFLIHENIDYSEPRHQVKASRVFGSAKGKYSLSPDFDAPLGDFEDCILKINKLKNDLLKYEKQFNMTNMDALKEYQNGNLGDDFDVMEWIALIENLLALEKQYEKICKSALVHS